MRNIILNTKRLIIRKPKRSDWKDLFEGVGEYDVSKMTQSIPYPYHKKDAVLFINKTLKSWGKDSYSFLIELKSVKKVIGGISLSKINLFNGTAITGSWINETPRAHARGIFLSKQRCCLPSILFSLALDIPANDFFADTRGGDKVSFRPNAIGAPIGFLEVRELLF